MPAYIIILLSLCIIVSCIFTIISFNKNLANLYFKTTASMLFTILGLFCLFHIVSKHYDKLSDNVLIGGFLIILALILCLIGDIILGMPRISELKRDRMPVIVGGATWFALGHLTYCIALILLFGISPWVIAFIIPMSLFYTFGNKLFGKLNYKKLTVGVFAYSLIESLSFALCVTALIFNFTIPALLLTIGFTLFYASDMVLMHNYFGEKKRIISILCHSFYYPAQILIAISLYFINCL